MKNFQDLTIETALSPEETIARISAHLPESWVRDQTREADLMINVGGKFYCFEFKSPRAGGARLWAASSDKRLTVTNIIPTDKTELTPDEYNEILQLFVACGVEGQFQYALTKDEIRVSDALGETSAMKLKAFSSAANKSSGHSHPLDDQRWLDFVHSTVQQEEKLDSHVLISFLIDEGWDAESAEELAQDFSYGSRAMKYALNMERGA